MGIWVFRKQRKKQKIDLGKKASVGRAVLHFGGLHSGSCDQSGVQQGQYIK